MNGGYGRYIRVQSVKVQAVRLNECFMGSLS